MRYEVDRVRRVEKGITALGKLSRERDGDEELDDEDRAGIHIIARALIDIWDGLNMPPRRGRER